MSSELTNRLALANMLGFQYSGDRDIYQALGYKRELTYDDYYAQYSRQDIAGAVIDRPVKATWRGDVDVIDKKDAEVSPFEKAWDDLYTQLKLKSYFVRLDKLTSLGCYGILLLGLSDVQTKDQLKDEVSKSSSLKLVYVKPYGQNSVDIQSYVTDPTNERFGLPLIYQITSSTTQTLTSVTLNVHYTRVIHVTQGLLDSEIFGTPSLMKVFNRLQDLQKIVGGSAEMFWRGARPGYQAKVDKDYQITKPMKDDLQNQIDEYENNLRRILANEGVSFEAMQTQVSNPLSHVDIQLQMISAETGIPRRILTGSEKGELASSQDRANWLDFVQDRRGEYAEPSIIKPFVDRCIELKILPKPLDDKYTVVWEDLFSVSEEDKAKVGKTKSEILKNYMANPMAETILPRELFLTLLLGLDETQLAQVKEMDLDSVLEEANSIEEDSVVEEVVETNKMIRTK